MIDSRDDDIVPIIDLDDVDAVDRIDEACSRVGFFQVRNHGVNPAVIDEMHAAMLEFFRLPNEEKSRWKSPDPQVSRGFSARGSQGVGYSMGVATPPDLVEAFTIARDWYPNGDPRFAPIPSLPSAFAPNIWPDTVPSMRPALTRYYTEVETVARTISALMARALELEEDFFVDKTDHSIDSLRVNYYAVRSDDHPALEGQHGLGPHTDYGIITILEAPPGPGLQIVGPDGSWHDVCPREGCLVVNLGDFLAQWTNDLWRSTIHRAVLPRPVEGATVERLSVPFFRQGNYDLIVECLPTCCSEDNPPRYPPVHAGEHFSKKLTGSRTFTSKQAVSTVGDRIRAVRQ